MTLISFLVADQGQSGNIILTNESNKSDSVLQVLPIRQQGARNIIQSDVVSEAGIVNQAQVLWKIWPMRRQLTIKHDQSKSFTGGFSQSGRRKDPANQPLPSLLPFLNKCLL